MDKTARKNKIWTKRKCCVHNYDTCVDMGIPVHRFPKIENLLFQWIEKTQVTCVSNQTIICGFQFEKSCYKDTNAQRRTLKRNSVPTLNLPTSSPDDSKNECNASNCETVSVTDGSYLNGADDPMSNGEQFCQCEHNVDMSDAPIDESDIIKLDYIENNSDVVHLLKEKLNKNNQDYVDKATQEDIEEVNVEMSKITVNKVVQTKEKRFSFLDLLKKDSDLKAFTGIDFSILEALEKSIRLIKNFDKDKKLCSMKERIILVLCKLKLCLSYDCLGVLFNISRSSACNYFGETIHLLAAVLEEVVYFPSKEEIRENLPDHFKEFTKTRKVLDCTEVAVESTRCLRCKLKMYSHYKGKQTLKILIGTTPSGLISFCSKCYGSRASDKVIVLSSDLLDKLTPYDDAVMTDKGFLIQEECDKNNITLIRPPFSNQSEQMSERDTLKINQIAAARVHIKRVIERMKNFGILKSTIDWDMTKYMDKIMIIICGLVNLSAPILNKSHYSL